jgi:hypothetical protein
MPSSITPMSFRHWFSVMGTFLPFAIITSAIGIWNMAGTDSRLSRRPQATAGTARMGPWPRRTWGPTQATRHRLGPPGVAWASRVGCRRPVAPVRRRALPHAAACGAWRAVAALGRAGAGGARHGRCGALPTCVPGGGPGRLSPDVPTAVARLLGASSWAMGPAGRAERHAPRARAACPSGPAAPRVRLARPRVPGLAGRGPAAARLLAPGARGAPPRTARAGPAAARASTRPPRRGQPRTTRVPPPTASAHEAARAPGVPTPGASPGLAPRGARRRRPPAPPGVPCPRASARCQAVSRRPGGGVWARQRREDRAHRCHGYGAHAAAWPRASARAGQPRGTGGTGAVTVPWHRPPLRVDGGDETRTA